MLGKCRKALEQPRRTLLMLYYSGVDTLEHKYGPQSEEVRSYIESFEFHLKSFLAKLSEPAKKRTMIVLTAAPGVCETSRTYYLKDYPEIVNNLTLPPVGDSRAAFLTAKQGRSENLKTALEKNVEGFRIVPSKELINLEAFGRTTDSTLLQATVGDLTALSACANAITCPCF